MKSRQQALTRQQQKTFDFIKKHIKTKGYSPSITEITKGIGLLSRGVAHRYVKALVDQGLIDQLPQQHRNIRLKNEQHSINLPITSLPVKGQIAAGQPIEAIPDNQQLDLKDIFGGKKLFLLKVKGDSMLGDNICDGDHILCENCDTVEKGSIAVVLIDREETTLKRLLHNPDNTITLLPSNPASKPQIYAANRITVQAKYLGLLRLVSR